MSTVNYDFRKEAEIIANNIGMINKPTIDYLKNKLEIAFTSGKLEHNAELTKMVSHDVHK